MARAGAATIGIIGVGSQARYQLRALTLVRPLQRVLADGRRSDMSAAYAEEMTRELGVGVQAVDNPERELDAAILGRADHVVCDLIAQCTRLGELHHAQSAGAMGKGRAITELGELVLQQRSIRARDEDVTVCDLTGVGVQHATIADYARRRAACSGSG